MKIAVIGLGSIGSRHLKNLVVLGHQVIGYDPVVEAKMIDAEWMGTPNVGSAMRDADGVVIASPTDCHLAHLRLAIGLGKPVLCEKPIADIGQASMVRDALAMAKKPVMMGNMLRFHPCVEEVKRSLKKTIGLPLWANFNVAQANEKYKEPVLLNWGAHECDLALYLLGKAKVLACVSTHSVANLIILHTIGARSHLRMDYITPGSYRGFLVHGEKDYVSADLERRLIYTGRDGIALNAGNKSWDEDYVEEMRAFIDLINGKPWPNAATGADGLATLELIEQGVALG